MDVKKCVLAWVAATVISFLLGGLWHSVLMGAQYEAATAAVARAPEEVNMAFVFLGYVVLGALMAYMYPIGAKGGSPASEGFRFGALVGLLWILPWSLVIVGIWNVGLRIVLIDAVWHIVEQGLAGIGVAYVYAMGAGAAESSGDASGDTAGGGPSSGAPTGGGERPSEGPSYGGGGAGERSSYGSGETPGHGPSGGSTPSEPSNY